MGWRRTAFVAIFHRFGAGVFRDVAFGRGCLLRRVTICGPACDALSEGQYCEPLGPKMLLLLLLLLPLLLLLDGWFDGTS